MQGEDLTTANNQLKLLCVLLVVLAFVFAVRSLLVASRTAAMLFVAD